MTGSSPPSAYERGRAEGETALRSNLLDVAGQLLADEGSGALTMRRVAEAGGCSTTVLYRLFGGKHGLVQGLYREGFSRLRDRLDEVPTGAEAGERLRQLALAYRDHALTEPAYYAVMFGRPVPEFEPSEADVAHARTSLQVLADAVADAQGSGQVVAGDPQRIAEVLWAAAHGAVGLELAGHLRGDDATRAFVELTAAAAARFTRGTRPPPA